jgi:phenylpropionate dioxygenase-like ring-hydroxylating dioxygenase large terminal subunit
VSTTSARRAELLHGPRFPTGLVLDTDDDMSTPRIVPGESLEEWIRPREIDSRVYHSEELFAAEIELIWNRVWVYLAHDSEIPQPGDYLRRTLGLDTVIVVRQEDGSVRVLLNRCAHRGNSVCLDDKGTSRGFRCPYHGWTYKTSGELNGVPYRSGYPEGFLDGTTSLTAVPRVDQYRGFIFASWSPEGDSLREHLGEAASRIDRFCDASPTGMIRLDAGEQRVRVGANWKIFFENTVDNYHQNFVHKAPLFSHPELRKTSKRVSGDASTAVVRDLGGGHAELDFKPEQLAMGRVHQTSAVGADPDAAAAYEAALVSAHGADRARDLLIGGPPHVFIFPNLFLLQQDVRVVTPVSVEEFTTTLHPAMLDGVPDAINWARLRRHEQAYGPAGSVLPDDIEIFERNQLALASATPSRLLLDRGIHRERRDEQGFPVSHLTDELGQRAIWRHYMALMSQGSGGDAGPPAAADAPATSPVGS